MTKSAKIAITIISIILLLSAGALFVCSYMAKSSPLTAEIYQNGVLLHSIDLGHVTSAYELVIEGESGSNTVLVEPGAISMLDATCPDHICVKTGKINSPLMPITCLPNKVVIQITGSVSDEFDIISY